jgi:6-phosphogluconolactonase
LSHASFQHAALILLLLLAAGDSRVAAQQPAAQRPAPAPPTAADTLAYVGTYTGPDSKGIYLFRMRTKNLRGSQDAFLEPLGLAAETPSPSFLAIDPRRRLLFAVNEVDEFDGQPGGAVSAFAIDPDTFKLKLINQQSTRGGGPCHLVLDPAGRHVIVANYGGGSVAVLPVAEDGALGPASDFIQHAGHGADADRQSGPHAHCITFSPDGKLVFVCDLGLDQVVAYKYDAAAGKLTPHDPPFTKLKAGAGPRHMAFTPDGRFAYVLNELNSTVTAFAYDASQGVLTEVQTLSTLPDGFDGENSTAEIAVHPSGKFLYASNRGHDSVVLFEIDGAAGTLTYVEDQATGGRTPRHFALDPRGEHLIIANQSTNTLRVCRIDGKNGRLHPSPILTPAPSPVCTVLLPPTE